MFPCQILKKNEPINEQKPVSKTSPIDKQVNTSANNVKPPVRVSRPVETTTSRIDHDETRQYTLHAEIAKIAIQTQVDQSAIHTKPAHNSLHRSAQKKALPPIMPANMAQVASNTENPISAETLPSEPKTFLPGILEASPPKVIVADFDTAAIKTKPETGQFAQSTLTSELAQDTASEHNPWANLVIQPLDSLGWDEPWHENGTTEPDWIELAISDILNEDTGSPSTWPISEVAPKPDFDLTWLNGISEQDILSDNQLYATQELMEVLPKSLTQEETESAITFSSAIIEISRQLREEEVELTEELRQDKINELTEVCLELLEVIGLKLEEEEMETFIRLILQGNYKQAENNPTIARLLEEGTHEQKQSSAYMLNMLMRTLSGKQKSSLHNIVGKLALKFRILPHYADATGNMYQYQLL